ncbi:MAG: 50S ribosomal protein L11 methyltransferase [Candidatus Marinimicrobia bacterium]|nr:50S ribosomal protein L11 methyltransferase [Candidatus Neomarinimicrobiota bacterium]
MMSYINLIIVTPEIDPRELADFLIENGGLAVAIINTDPDSTATDKWFDDPSQPSIIAPESAAVSVMLPQDSAIDNWRALIAEHFNLMNLPKCKIEIVPDRDWVRTTQMLSSPQQITERLWIIPTWESIVDQTAINIRLDPGIAFGSGTHPTTTLCLRWLDKNIQGGEKVLDYGSGSGILGIAALKLGAAEAVGVDIDPQANAAAFNNAAINQVEFPTCLPEELATAKFDIIVANILANPLLELAQLFSELLSSGGKIALSGILEAQSAAIMEIYQHCFSMSPPENMGDWLLLSGQK